MSWLVDNCPRLARARDGFLADRARERKWQIHLSKEQLRLERLVAQEAQVALDRVQKRLSQTSPKTFYDLGSFNDL